MVFFHKTSPLLLEIQDHMVYFKTFPGMKSWLAWASFANKGCLYSMTSTCLLIFDRHNNFCAPLLLVFPTAWPNGSLQGDWCCHRQLPEVYHQEWLILLRLRDE